MDLPASVWRKDWVVYCKPAVQGTGKVLNYLGRYIHRVAITNHRILSIDDGKVTFRCKDSHGALTKTMTVSAMEFIRRFLQHVLPKGVHKVRYYGLWSPSNRQYLAKMQQVLIPVESTVPKPCEADTQAGIRPSPESCVCPYCKKGTLVWIGRLPRQGRAPP
jgi:hypothetical protein